MENFQNPEWLYKEHVVNKRTKSDMARESGVSHSAICYNLKKFEIESPEKEKVVVKKVKCRHCGKKFQPVDNYAAKLRKYCSKKCSSEGQKTHKNCAQCGKVFHAKIHYVNHCSRECGHLSTRKYRGNILKCLICDNDFGQTHPTQVYCSSNCQHKGMKVEKLSYCCIECGKDFEVYPSRLNYPYDIKYCSQVCREQYGAKNGWSDLVQVAREQMIANPTKLEIFGYAKLSEWGFKHDPQFVIKENFVVDAYLPDYNLIIQFDGDYWHGNPLIYLDPTERQLSQMKRDKSQDTYLAACGYTVIRIWESVIYKEPELLRAKILSISKSSK